MQNNYFFRGQFSNIYKKSNKFSEVTSQILYGEKFKILSKNKKWIKIKTLFDNYVGYIKNKKYTDKYKVTHKVYSLKANIFKKPNNKTKNLLPFGSKISVINENILLNDFKKVSNINNNEDFFLTKNNLGHSSLNHFVESVFLDDKRRLVTFL